MATGFVDGWWQSPDGLRLHYRDYPGRSGDSGDGGRPPILCLPGLTRNARDFEALAARLSPEWRVICAELRGRGESAYATDPQSYQPATYIVDIETLLIEIGAPRVVLFGTSLGGIVSMALAAADATRVAGMLLNDIGPVIEAAGLARIRAYVGKGANWPTWLHAARGVAEVQRGNFPGYGLDDWLGMAKRVCRLTPQGRIRYDYDLRIAEPIRDANPDAPAPDLWPLLDGLDGVPATVLRGAASDLLSAETAARMAAKVPGLDLVTVDGVGHAPTLDEPEAVAAIDRLLARVVAPQAASAAAT